MYFPLKPDIECPKHIENSFKWTEVHADMMSGLGFNAVSAPSTKGE